jgi:hypothetical protein
MGIVAVAALTSLILRRVIKPREKGDEEIKLDADEVEKLAEINLENDNENEAVKSELPEVEDEVPEAE